jgi:D-arabinose 1-dehydrogenase-like Zn-dependent alcohol dehydrogenase
MTTSETSHSPPDGQGSMNALRFHGQNDLRYEKIPIPRVKAGQVKIKPAWVGICGTGKLLGATDSFIEADK